MDGAADVINPTRRARRRWFKIRFPLLRRAYIADALEFAPLLLVEPSGVHIHRIRFFMPEESSNSTRKPRGVLGAKLYLKIDGAAGTDLKEYQLIAMDTKSPYEYAHSAANAGKTAHYIAIWTTKDEEDSPQSEVFSLVIT